MDRLREAAPEGIDVYFDTVGGAQLSAAIEVMNPHGRIALCGALSHLPPTVCARGVVAASPVGFTCRSPRAKRGTNTGAQVMEGVEVGFGGPVV